MDTGNRTIVVCSCERTMEVDTDAIARACGGTVRRADQLCRRQLDLFKSIVAEGRAVTVGCTQEAPLFDEAAEELGGRVAIAYANLRETAGWSVEGGAAGPKMAALIAAACEEMPATPMTTLESTGVALVYGRDAAAIDAARHLASRLDVTVLLTGDGEIAPPRVTDFPVLRGTIRAARGHLGAFELTVDGFARPAPSSRARLEFVEPRDGAVSRCDVILDLAGGAPLFPAPALRDGYLRADPRDDAAVVRALFAASDFVGTFDKPRYVTFEAGLCAHSRSRRIGCTRCLDLCPAGAIQPEGDHVAIDEAICAGCGACAAACPTGAASYALPPADALMRRLRALLLAYAAAGGRDAVVLLHDGEHGAALIDALARFGDGLPANVLPLAVNEVTQVGPEAIAAAFAWGATGVRLLTRARPRHDMTGLARTIETSGRIVAALGFGAEPVGAIETDDPDALGAALRGLAPGTPSPRPANFLPMGAKRGVLVNAVRELHRAAPAPVDSIALPAHAPFGGIEVRVDGCTLCLACVAACPSAALGDDPEKPTLSFDESLCVQCGLCASTCPEKVIALAPRLDFAAWEAGRRVVKQEEPFACTRCGKAFGTRGAVERVKAKLGAGHWMFSGANARRLELITLCDTCRVEAVMNEGLDPYAAGARPRPRTTEDYLRERAAGKDDLPDE